MKHTINNPLVLKKGDYFQKGDETNFIGLDSGYILEDKELVSKEVAEGLLKYLKITLPFAKYKISVEQYEEAEQAIKNAK